MKRNQRALKESQYNRRDNRKREDKVFHTTFKVEPLAGKTAKQKEYLAALRNSEQVFAIGPAGTGKTYLPTAVAADRLREKSISKIVLTRPNVPAGPSLGFFPGELEEKMAPWVVPFMEVIKQRMTPGEFEYNVKAKKIDIVPFETMRGRTFDNSVVIVDEAQNLTDSEMYMVLTRIGENTQLIVTGDLRQKDIKVDSGLGTAIKKVEDFKLPVSIVQFGVDDVVRGGIAGMWVKAWN